VYVPSNPAVLDDVITVVVETLGIEERRQQFSADTPLLGSVAELDSMAIVELVGALEDRFDFEIDEDDITGDVFESVGTLAAFVSSCLP
jgi:acyl carrier protein